MTNRPEHKTTGIQEHSVMLDEKGFTLFELLVVMFLIILILSISSVFVATSLKKDTLQSTVREISLTMKYARTLSEMNGEAQIVIINLDENKYRIKSREAKSISKNINVTVIDPLLKEIIEGIYEFVFYPFGGVEGGAIILEYKNRLVTLELDPVIGMVAANKK
jgi:hypothetical protein